MMILYLNSSRKLGVFHLQADGLDRAVRSKGKSSNGKGIVDRPPPDTGCIFSPSCLECRRERCIEDEDRQELHRNEQRREAADRHQNIAEMVIKLEDRGISRTEAVRQVAQQLGISGYSVWWKLRKVDMPPRKRGRPRKHGQ